MAEHEIAYRYHKTKGRYYGIPARDLTQTDYDRLPLELQVVVDAGSAYTAVEHVDLTKLSRDELNARAVEAGVEKPEDLKNKDDVIKAIEQAASGQNGGAQ